jgi:uncharacterized membrane protein
MDPFGTAVLVGLAFAPIGAFCMERGRRAGALGGVLFGGALFAAERLGAPVAPIAVAACVAAAATLALPGLPFGLFRRRSFGSAYPRGAFAGAASTALLPRSLAARRPSRLLDAADRLKLEGTLAEIERKHGVAIAVALVARASEIEGAHARGALFGGAVGLAAAAAAGASALAGLGAAALGVVVGRALSRSARVRRLVVSESALAASHASAASDAFAHAGLAAAPGGRGLLVFASLFEARVAALATHGLAGTAEPALQAIADAAAHGLASGRALDGLLAAAAGVERLAAREPAGGTPAGPLPHPVRVED